MAAAGSDAKIEAEELPDFDEATEGNGAREDGKDGGGHGTGAITASGFRDFLLRPELMKALVACGFEHPSEVQHACIPQAMLGTDILCQAKSGMGKTAVFVLTCLQHMPEDLDASAQRDVSVLVLCHTRELAYQIQHEFKRLGQFVKNIKISAVFGGHPTEKDRQMLKDGCHVLVGTPGRVLQLVREEALKLGSLSRFILDECDRCIDELGLRRDVQQIFIKTPRKKQVMMFTATLTPETASICKKFMTEPHEITVESQSKLTLHGLLQYYVQLEERQKNKKLIDMLDSLEFNQVVIFVKSVKRALALDGLLNECNFPSMTLHPESARLSTGPPRGKKGKGKGKRGNGDVAGKSEDKADIRLDQLQAFKDFKKRILVSTDLFGRGMDVERVNIVINYDMPETSDAYLHRVGRAGRFGTKGLAVTFSATPEDTKVLKSVQERFEVSIPEMPDKVDTTSYLNA